MKAVKHRVSTDFLLHAGWRVFKGHSINWICSRMHRKRRMNRLNWNMPPGSELLHPAFSFGPRIPENALPKVSRWERLVICLERREKWLKLPVMDILLATPMPL